MSWIQENTFVAGLAGATAVIGGAILFFGISQGGKYDEKLEKYEELKVQQTKLEKLKPYPTYENRKDREAGMADYEKTIKDVRNLVTGYRPEKLVKMTPADFKDIQVKMEIDLRKAFDDAGTTLPENCLFGFEKYATDPVKAVATPKLNYELEALQWMFKKLSEVKPETITNIRRAELPEESGRVTQVTTKKGKKDRSRGNAERSSSAAGRAYELMPVEVSFTANEVAVRKFLIEMVNSNQYYYAIRGVRIRNEKQNPPSEGDAGFPNKAPSTIDDDFTGMEELLGDGAESESPDAGSSDVFGEGEELGEGVGESPKSPVSPEIPAGELILKQVLGNEKLHVHIVFDIVLIEKKAKDAKRPGKSKANR